MNKHSDVKLFQKMFYSWNISAQIWNIMTIQSFLSIYFSDVIKMNFIGIQICHASFLFNKFLFTLFSILLMRKFDKTSCLFSEEIEIFLTEMLLYIFWSYIIKCVALLLSGDIFFYIFHVFIMILFINTMSNFNNDNLLIIVFASFEFCVNDHLLIKPRLMY